MASMTRTYIAAINAFFNTSNRMMSFTGTRPDDEFYGFGR